MPPAAVMSISRGLVRRWYALAGLRGNVEFAFLRVPRRSSRALPKSRNMTAALVSKQFVAGFGDEIRSVARAAGKTLDLMTLPEPAGARLSQADCGRIDCTFAD